MNTYHSHALPAPKPCALICYPLVCFAHFCALCLVLVLFFFLIRNTSLSQITLPFNLFGRANCGLNSLLWQLLTVPQCRPHPILTPRRLKTCWNETQQIADGSVCIHTSTATQWSAIHSVTRFRHKSMKARADTPTSGFSECAHKCMDVAKMYVITGPFRRVLCGRSSWCVDVLCLFPAKY